MFPSVSFSTRRLVFRSTDAQDKDDVAHLRQIHADPITLFKTMGSPPAPMNNAKAEEFAKFCDSCVLSVFICLPKSETEPHIPGKVIGWMCLAPMTLSSAHHNKTHFGISLQKDYQGKGYGGEALEWLLDWGFKIRGLHKIEGEVFAWNEPALKVYTKLGFVKEGLKRQSLWQEGAFRDEVILGMLLSDWEAAKATRVPSTVE
ncbi:acyl-CoA N-acyltransferase [Meredithblackwellia eburnea MCA 4105]